MTTKTTQVNKIPLLQHAVHFVDDTKLSTLASTAASTTITTPLTATSTEQATASSNTPIHKPPCINPVKQKIVDRYFKDNRVRLIGELRLTVKKELLKLKGVDNNLRDVSWSSSMLKQALHVNRSHRICDTRLLTKSVRIDDTPLPGSSLRTGAELQVIHEDVNEVNDDADCPFGDYVILKRGENAPIAGIPSISTHPQSQSHSQSATMPVGVSTSTVNKEDGLTPIESIGTLQTFASGRLRDMDHFCGVRIEAFMTFIAKHLGDWKSIEQWTSLIQQDGTMNKFMCTVFRRRITHGADKFMSDTQPLFYEQTNRKYCIHRRFTRINPVTSDAKILEVCFTEPRVNKTKPLPVIINTPIPINTTTSTTVAADAVITSDVTPVPKQTMYEYIDATASTAATDTTVKRKSSDDDDTSVSSSANKKQRTAGQDIVDVKSWKGTVITPTSIAINTMTTNTMYAPNLSLLFPSAEETTDLYNKIRSASLQAAQIALSELDACRLTAVTNGRPDFDWCQTPFINKAASIPNMSTASLQQCMHSIFELLQVRSRYILRYKDEARTILNVSFGHLINRSSSQASSSSTTSS